MKHFNSYNEKEFIQDCINKHGDYYDYSIVVLGKSIENIEVICPKHGVFEIKAVNHKSGFGCRKCSNDKNKFESTKSKKKFEKEGRELHYNLYSYENFEYIYNKI